MTSTKCSSDVTTYGSYTIPYFRQINAMKVRVKYAVDVAKDTVHTVTTVDIYPAELSKDEMMEAVDKQSKLETKWVGKTTPQEAVKSALSYNEHLVHLVKDVTNLRSFFYGDSWDQCDYEGVGEYEFETELFDGTWTTTVYCKFRDFRQRCPVDWTTTEVSPSSFSGFSNNKYWNSHHIFYDWNKHKTSSIPFIPAAGSNAEEEKQPGRQQRGIMEKMSTKVRANSLSVDTGVELLTNHENVKDGARIEEVREYILKPAEETLVEVWRRSSRRSPYTSSLVSSEA